MKQRTFLQSLNHAFTLTSGIFLILIGAYMAWAAWWNIDELPIKMAVLLVGVSFTSTGAWYIYRGKR